MSLFLHRCELRLAALGVALLFAQFGAITHAYSHAYAHGASHAYTHGAAASSSHHSGAGRAAGGRTVAPGAVADLDADAAAGGLDAAGSATNHLCSDCLAFAPLLAVAGAPSPLPFMQPQGRAASSRDSTLSRIPVSPTLAFRSRAPPYSA